MSVESRRQKSHSQTCRQCRIRCCQGSRPPITKRRREIIEEYLKGEGLPADNLFVQSSYTHPREDQEGYCIFYGKSTGRCRIQPVKPETCLAGPITFDIDKESNRIVFYLKTERICPLAGILIRNEERLAEHLESAKKEILKLVQDLDSEALHAILRIEEPDTFQIDQDSVAGN